MVPASPNSNAILSSQLRQLNQPSTSCASSGTGGVLSNEGQPSAHKTGFFLTQRWGGSSSQRVAFAHENLDALFQFCHSWHWLLPGTLLIVDFPVGDNLGLPSVNSAVSVCRSASNLAKRATDEIPTLLDLDLEKTSSGSFVGLGECLLQEIHFSSWRIPKRFKRLFQPEDLLFGLRNSHIGCW